MRRFGGLDAELLCGETAASHMHVAGLIIVDPAGVPTSDLVKSIRDLTAGMVAAVPPLRDKAVMVPFGLDRPVWVADADFNIDAHLHHVAVPSPGGTHELAALVGDIVGTKLDRSRPLWEMWVIEGLVDGHIALLTKIHHCALDGMSGALMMGAMLTLDPDAAPAAASDGEATFEGEPVPSDLELVVAAFRSALDAPRRAVEPIRKTAAALQNLARQARSPAPSATMPFSAPPTSLNRPVTPRRAVAFRQVPLDDVKAVKDAFGVKVNDVVLAAVAGSLRRYLDVRGELPTEPLTAAVPVSTRGPEDMGSWGNMVSGLFATLATDVADPVVRLHKIHEGTEHAKALYASGLEDAAMDWTEVPAPFVFNIGAQLVRRLRLGERLPPVFNLLVSNVPGPPVPLYASGARVAAVYPMGPILGHLAINLTVLSYCDMVGFGFLTCPDVVDDEWELADGVVDALGELVKMAG